MESTLKSDIGKIVETAVHAPSGDNMQPWCFEVKGNSISLFNTAKEAPIFDFAQRSSLFSCGTVIENCVIASAHYGYVCTVGLFPEENNVTYVAKLVLTSNTDIKNDSLYEVITTRCTNRGAYRDDSLSEEEKEKLFSAVKAAECGGELRIVEDRKTKKTVAESSTVYEWLLFQNKALHDVLYKELRWTKQKAGKTRDGLYAKTLGLSVMDTKMFKLLGSWKVVRLLQSLKLMRLMGGVIAGKSEHRYMTAGAFYAVVMEGNSREDYVNGGRICQRLWLEVARLGLQAQPISGILFLSQPVVAGAKTVFTDAQQQKMLQAVERFNKAFDVGKKNIVFVLRVGKGIQPDICSLRREPEIRFI